MTIPVIDACVAIKWFLPEDKFKEASKLLHGFNRMIVPDLFFIEFDAIVTKKVRQRLVEPSDSYKLFNEIRNLPLDVVPYSMISKIALDLSVTLPITQYDACYLSVAIGYNQRVYTADQRFVNGMKNTPFQEFVEAL